MIIALLDYEDLPLWLKHAREHRDLSQREMAKIVHSTQAAICAFERRGSTSKIPTAQPIARALGYRIKIAILPYKDEEEEEL